jgi:hypothetical protein
MVRSEFKQLCHDALMAVIELAEEHHKQPLSRECYLRWFPGQDLIRDNVVDALVDKLYTSETEIHPCCDIGVAEVTEDGIPVIIALVSGHKPGPFVEQSWSGRPGPFNYYLVGQLSTVPLPKGVFGFSIVPNK